MLFLNSTELNVQHLHTQNYIFCYLQLIKSIPLATKNFDNVNKYKLYKKPTLNINLTSKQSSSLIVQFIRVRQLIQSKLSKCLVYNFKSDTKPVRSGQNRITGSQNQYRNRINRTEFVQCHGYGDLGSSIRNLGSQKVGLGSLGLWTAVGTKSFTLEETRNTLPNLCKCIVHLESCCQLKCKW